MCSGRSRVIRTARQLSLRPYTPMGTSCISQSQPHPPQGITTRHSLCPYALLAIAPPSCQLLLLAAAAATVTVATTSSPVATAAAAAGAGPAVAAAAAAGLSQKGVDAAPIWSPQHAAGLRWALLLLQLRQLLLGLLWLLLLLLGLLWLLLLLLGLLWLLLPTAKEKGVQPAKQLPFLLLLLLLLLLACMAPKAGLGAGKGGRPA